MSLLPSLEPRTTPPRLFPLSLAAVALVGVVVLSFPEETRGLRACLGVLTLVPAFVFAYYRGWTGAAAWAGAAAGVLGAAACGALLAGRSVPWSPAVPGVVATYAGIALAVGILAEVLRRERERAVRLALTDDLTGLPNRRSARWFLEKEFAAAERGRPVAVVLFDLDRFKRYNDRHGHPAGDAALRAVGRALDRVTRRMNLCARFGGEEFVCILSAAGVDEALAFVERVRAALREAEVPAEPVTASAGVAVYHPAMRTPDDLLAAADRALYRAKREGGDRVRVAEERAADLAGR